ncbi:hypothetical protein B0A50_00565 [Salinomyces thailandicus]|uniref:ATPase synthesis protein 25 n=1 Tax=Salinomyces thailandicus TaxID=706561 RepID=A0A4V5N5Y2_9PEZI|nr:hypothetical protein B0A50_00565 [Salinomyces thailandica]
MALPTTALRSLACTSCRQRALRSFIASIGGPSSTIPPPPPPLQRRAFSDHPTKRNEARERLRQREEHVLNDINDIETDTPTRPATLLTTNSSDSSTQPSDTPDSTPWYLQPAHQPLPTNHPSPLLARQQLPPLPANPPPILHPLLTHLSDNLGLDDLTLLDLRSLHPSPALGPNLLMILSTARSEKHLHVSADRLCRHLRSEPYFLTPFADGLLGRNELKLKVRRRAKRMRLVAGVGGKGMGGGEGEVEEGVRSGWVCVNVGRVEGGEIPGGEVEQGEREGFVGFGKKAGGSGIVVQMLTEEKREELGLERLWEGMLRRSSREKEEAELREVESRKDPGITVDNSDIRTTGEMNPHKAADMQT